MSKLSMIKMFNEALDEKKAPELKEFDELILKVTPNRAFHDNENEQEIKINLNNTEDNIGDLYRAILDGELSNIQRIIKEYSLNVNANEEKFNESNGKEEFATPLALAVWYTFWTGEAIENILYLIKEGSNKNGKGITSFISELEDYRLDSNTEDFTDWETIREIFDIDEALSVDDELAQDEKDKEESYQDSKEHNKRDLQEKTSSAIDKKYDDTAAGAIEALTELSSYNTTNAYARPDPSVRGVWLVTCPENKKHNAKQFIVYLKGYKDPLGQIREVNDFEGVD